MSEDPVFGRTQGEARRIKAEAIGEPGSRRFRILAVVEDETRIVWMEKEQLRRLGEALSQVLEQLPVRGPNAGPESDIGGYELETRHQLRAGRMELGYDEDRDRLIIIAHEFEATSGDPPGFACRISRAQARVLSDEAEHVVSAGRPICPLCGSPVGPDPHTCAKQNGHFPARLEDVQDDPELGEGPGA